MVCILLPIFAANNEVLLGMKEKDYPYLEEEQGLDMAAEPAVALDYPAIDTADDTDYDFRGYDFGMPRTLEELEADLEQAEREMGDPDKWCTSEQMWADIKQTFPWANIR